MSILCVIICATFLYTIVVLRNIGHKADNSSKTSFPDLVAMADFYVH